MSISPSPHSPLEDGLALLTGCALMAFGVYLLKLAGLVTGGTVGLALLLTHVTGLSFSWLFILVNLPFFVLALVRMGRQFTLRTICCVVLVALFAHLWEAGIQINWISGVYSALLGGTLCGIGLLILFRHQASLGGFNILALWWQQHLGWRAGKVQMGLDSLVVAGSALLVPWQTLLLSVVAAVWLNTILAQNHKPGRYLPTDASKRPAVEAKATPASVL